MTNKPKKSASDQQYSDEATLLRKVNEWLALQERNGIKALRICDRYAKGYSDLFICAKGIFVCAELKDDTGKPSAHQLIFIDEMQRCGAICGVCRTVKEVQDLVDKALERAGQISV